MSHGEVALRGRPRVDEDGDVELLDLGPEDVVVSVVEVCAARLRVTTLLEATLTHT